MSTALDYVREYGNKSFKEMPFGDVDNIVLCSIFYMNFDKVVSPGMDPIPYSEMCEKMFAYNGYKHLSPALMLRKEISVMMMETANSKRYSEMKVYAVESVFEREPAVQFAAATFILPDGNIAIVFRGTDDTFVGWKEDMDLYTRKGIPSHKLAVDYINKIAPQFDGGIIICGHSKGGNVALYGALNCERKYRDRFVKVFNNDGPGFINDSYLYSRAYQDIRPHYRHFVPSSAFIGMLLFHDDDYIAVKNKHLIGLIQHDLGFWKTEGANLAVRDDVNIFAKITDQFLKTFIYRVSDEQGSLVDSFAVSLIENTDLVNLTQFSQHPVQEIRNIVRMYKASDDMTHEALADFVDGMGKLLVNSTKSVMEVAGPVFEKGSKILTKVFG